MIIDAPLKNFGWVLKQSIGWCIFILNYV